MRLERRPLWGPGRALVQIGLCCACASAALAQAPQPVSPPSPGPSTALPATASTTGKPATAPDVSKPGPGPGAVPPQAAAPSASPHAAATSSLEERLRRMEEAYSRMEQSNRQIQSQYDALLRKYDDLSRKMSSGASPSSSRTRTVSRGVATGSGPNQLQGLQVSEPAGLPEAIVEGDASQGPQPDPALEAQLAQRRAGGAEGTGGRTAPGTLQPQPSGAGAAGGIGREDVAVQPNVPEPPAPSGMSRMDRIGGGAEGTGGRTYIRQQPAALPVAREGERAEPTTGRDLKPKKHPGKIAFGEGLEFTSDDDEFKMQFHNLTQAEYRGFDRRDLGVLNDQFFIPRQRWYFVGEMTKNFGFYTVINRGYGTLDLLDGFMTIRVADQLRFRLGRMKTPYLYEYFQISEGDLIAPERSIYTGNMVLNRQIGAMALGTLFDGRLDYQAGLFNGPRRSFQDLNSAKDFVGNITTRPWLKSERLPALNYLNLGGSWTVGYEDNNPPQPIFFETANDQTPNNAQSLSPTFLALNKNVIELGNRVQWGAHAVWYYRSLLLLAEYGGGRAGYGFVNDRASTPINYNGWNVTASYFLTGEQLTRRVNVAKPRNDFTFAFLKGGAFTPGAIELLARYSTMDFGHNIFTAGFADPNLWSNHVWATDIGMNWYLNFYTKIMLDWQHAEFGNPVSVAPGKFSSTTDLYWVRFQLFF